LGVLPDGTKDILGLWIEQTEGAKFWLRVMNELKGRGVSDILIAVLDGLRGFPEAIIAVFPQTVVQTWSVGSLRKPRFGGNAERAPEGIGRCRLLRVRLGMVWRGRRHGFWREVQARTRRWRPEWRQRAA
jgi:hypothetical protein